MRTKLIALLVAPLTLGAAFAYSPFAHATADPTPEIRDPSETGLDSIEFIEQAGPTITSIDHRGGSVELEWADAGQVSSYMVFVSVDNGESFTYLNTVQGRSYSHEALDEQTLTFHVTALAKIDGVVHMTAPGPAKSVRINATSSSSVDGSSVDESSDSDGDVNTAESVAVDNPVNPDAITWSSDFEASTSSGFNGRHDSTTGVTADGRTVRAETWYERADEGIRATTGLWVDGEVLSLEATWIEFIPHEGRPPCCLPATLPLAPAPITPRPTPNLPPPDTGGAPDVEPGDGSSTGEQGLGDGGQYVNDEDSFGDD